MIATNTKTRYQYQEGPDVATIRQRITELKAQGGSLAPRLADARARADAAQAELTRAEVGVLTRKTKPADVDRCQEKYDKLQADALAIPRQADSSARAIAVLEDDLRQAEQADKARYREELTPAARALVQAMADALLAASEANDEMARMQYETCSVLSGWLSPWRDLRRVSLEGNVIDNQLTRWLAEMKRRGLLD